MAFPQNVMSLTFGGSLADGNEIWSCGMHLAVPGDSAGTTTLFTSFAALSPNIATLLEDYIANPAVLVPAGVELEWVKVALLDTAGKYIGLPNEVQASATGSQAGSYIPQAAIVNTLTSDVWRGAGKYNRFYLPVSLVSFPDGYGLQTFNQTAYATATAELIEDINSVMEDLSPGSGGLVVVASAAGSGHVNPVQAVRLGKVVDTQRRRRNNLPEAYVDVPVVI